jgi:hypothetical protein
MMGVVDKINLSQDRDKLRALVNTASNENSGFIKCWEFYIYICLSEAKASHSHRAWTEVFSSVPHFLQVGLLPSPITYRCLLKVLCPVSRSITTLDCVLLKDSNRAPVARSGQRSIFPEVKRPGSGADYHPFSRQFLLESCGAAFTSGTRVA